MKHVGNTIFHKFQIHTNWGSNNKLSDITCYAMGLISKGSPSVSDLEYGTAHHREKFAKILMVLNITVLISLIIYVSTLRK